MPWVTDSSGIRYVAPGGDAQAGSTTTQLSPGDARRLTVAFDGVSSYVDVPHRLGRAYTGGWIGDAPTALSVSAPASTGLAHHGTDNTPLGLWQLDGDLTDASGNGFDLSGTPDAYTPGRVGLALRTTGAGVSRTSGSELNLTGAMSLCAWVFPTSLSGSPEIVCHAASGETSATNFTYQIGIDSGAITYFHEYGSGTNLSSVVSGYDLSVNSWNWIGFTRDSLGTGLKIFLNDTKVHDVTLSNAASGGGSGGLYVGSTPTTAEKWPGLISSLAIFDSELTEVQMLAEYNSCIATAGSTTVTGSRTLLTEAAARGAGVDTEINARFTQAGTPTAETIYAWVY